MSRLYTPITARPASNTGVAPQLHQSLPICAAPTNRRYPDGTPCNHEAHPVRCDRAALSQLRDVDGTLSSNHPRHPISSSPSSPFKAHSNARYRTPFQAGAHSNHARSAFNQPAYFCEDPKGMGRAPAGATLARDVVTQFKGCHFQTQLRLQKLGAPA